MALRLKRETVGDILVGEGLAVAFVYCTVAPSIMDGIAKIGGTGVAVREGAPETLPEGAGFAELDGTVASLRLDAVLSLCTGLSRENAAELIRARSVQLGGAVCEDTAAAVKEGDRLSARGHGKFRLATVGNVTRKGRTHITIWKYL